MSIKSKAANTASKFAVAEPKLHEEDGWIFRERPGVPVECIGRVAEVEIVEMTPPNQIRHNCPSA